MELSVVLSLVTGLANDTSDFGRVQYARLLALLTERPPVMEEPPVAGIIARLIATPKSEGGFDEISRYITDRYYPTADEPSLEGARLEEALDPDCIILSPPQGRRDANAAETLFYGIKNPDEKGWIAGFGQKGEGDCVGYVVAVYTRDGSRCAGIDTIGGAAQAVARRLTFPMMDAELAALRNA